ncbi:MAG: AAA family ATPase, partial [Planctomycetota bacterium]
ENVYRWAYGELKVRRDALPEPPAWLVEALDKLHVPAPGVPHHRIVPPVPGDEVEPRAVAYLAAMPPAVSGQGGHNATYAAATALVHGFCLAPEKALELLLAHYNPRCEPLWSEKELRHKVEDAAVKPHTQPFGWLRDQETDPERGVDLSAFAKAPADRSGFAKAPADRSGFAKAPADMSGLMPPKTMTQPDTPPQAISGPRSLRELVLAYPTLRPPVIEGLLREGETMNVIAQSKLGKSWLVIDLALSIASGRPWLGMECAPGEVLIIDNELHGETSAHRVPKVAAARKIDLATVADRLYVENLRGRLQDLFALGPYFHSFPPGRFKVVILDAFYRFLPLRADENDNGTMAGLYNYLDSFADYLKCCFVLIHHTSKGNQSLKELTDVGAGAGAQSRATDTHLVLRRHEEEDAVVMDAAVRSWPPRDPMCLRWAWPVWTPDYELDPGALKKEGGKKSSGNASQNSDSPKWSAEVFAERFLSAEPKSQARILEEAEQAGLSSRRTKRFLELAEEEGLAFRWVMGPRNTQGYATVEQPEDERQDDRKRAAVQALLITEPELTSKEVAERCNVSRQYVNRIRKEAE